MSEIAQNQELHSPGLRKGLRRFFTWLKRPRSLGSKLSQWNALVLFIALALIELIVYQLVIYNVISNLDAQLYAQGNRIEAITRQWTASGQPSDLLFFKQLARGSPVNEFSTTSLSIKIYDIHTGRLLATSPYLSQVLLPLSHSEFEAALQGQHTLGTFTNANGDKVHALTLPLYDKAQHMVAVAQLTQSLQFVKQLQVMLAAILAAGGIIAVAIAYGVGIVLTSWELRPLRRLITTIQSLNAQRLGEVRYHPRILTTEVIQLTLAFNSMLDRLQASFARQRSFIANLSHEMRTPLTAIRGEVDVLLLDPELKDGMRQYLQDIRTELRRLSHLVTNLLTSARDEAGMPPQPFLNGIQMVELDALVVEVAREARFLYHRQEQPAKDLLQIDKLEQIHIPGDADLLKQLLLNLIDNAITHSAPSGQATLSLTLSHNNADLSGQETVHNQVEWAVLSVCDTGPGIDPADLPHIFERYYRARNTRVGGKIGLGLGLFIARLIAEAHEGYITVESEPGEGTCFHAWLPTTHM